jgi:ectoine hydroxylase-related dioxygenase (phytanoyl-CoA dioxygenase family)
MPRRLTPEQVEQFRRDGYVSPVRVMSEEEALAIRRKTEAFEAAQGRPLSGLQTSKCCLLFPWIYGIVSREGVLDAVEDLIGPDILLYQNGAWFKNPDSDAYVSWHQDATYYGMDPLDLVTCWIALSPATLESGCMQVLPGSHREGQLPVEYTEVTPDNLLASGQNTLIDRNAYGIAPMELRPGEMSMHHVCLVHSSRPNRGADRRMGFSMAYMGPHVRQTTALKASAMVMRGKDDYGYYPLDEVPPVSEYDPATIERHARAVTLYRNKAKQAGNQTAWRLTEIPPEAARHA